MVRLMRREKPRPGPWSIFPSARRCSGTEIFWRRHWAREPGAMTAEAAERAIAGIEREGGLHAARGLKHGRHWTTDAAMARESEAIALMRAGQGAEKTIMRGWIAETKLHGGRLNEGQKKAVKLILSSRDRVLGVQGYAGTGKTTMLKRLRVLAESRGYNAAGLAPSASAARTLERESGIGSETVQKFLARHEGIIEGRGTARGLRNLRASFSKTVLVVDESSLASSEQMRGLLRVATTLRVPRVVLVGDEKQLGAVGGGEALRATQADRYADRGYGRDPPAAGHGPQGSGPCGLGGRGQDRVREARGQDRTG